MKHTFPLITGKSAAIPVHTVSKNEFSAWLKKQPAEHKKWLNANEFTGDKGSFCLLPGKSGAIAAVVCGVDEELNIWSIAHLPAKLPKGTYALAGKHSGDTATQLALGWALASYQFSKYKKIENHFAKLIAPEKCDIDYVKSMFESICWARDMINTPANDMHPEALASEAATWGKQAGGKVTVLKGEALLKANYPTIYTVGKASSVPPHLVDIRFPRKGAPKVTLVGKGVCFDSGGLDIKPTSAMKLMKKDMAGAANVLALAKTLVESKLPIELRILLPIVENAVSGNAMRPLDIVKTRKGITVEIGNTDAEGRLILCDALYEADQDKPDLIIDCATLTGAARVALGLDMPAFFTPDDTLAKILATHSKKQQDPLWRLPLYTPYRSFLDTGAADISNDPDSGFGGAITAALYLKEFVTNTISWIHIDMMSWNTSNRPGRPQGGEVMAIRAIYSMLKETYGK